MVFNIMRNFSDSKFLALCDFFQIPIIIYHHVCCIQKKKKGLSTDPWHLFCGMAVQGTPVLSQDDENQPCQGQEVCGQKDKYIRGPRPAPW